MFNSNDINSKFNSFTTTYTEDEADSVLKNERKIIQIMQNKSLAGFLDDAKLYFQMLKDYFSGKYKEVPLGIVAAIIGTLLYVLSPVDLISDVIPIVGYLDDTTVFTMCLKFTEYDLEKYRCFREKQRS